MLIRSELTPPAKWPLARVTIIHPGRDGITRVVDLRRGTTTLRRPIAKVTRSYASNPRIKDPVWRRWAEYSGFNLYRRQQRAFPYSGNTYKRERELCQLALSTRLSTASPPPYYKARRRHIATPAVFSSRATAERERETAAEPTYCTLRGTKNFGNKNHTLFSSRNVIII